MQDDTPDSETLNTEISALRQEIADLNRHRFVRAHDSWMGLLAYNFLRGLAMGLGTVVGATILVSIAAYFLTRIDFVPIIGEWAARIAQEIQPPP